MGKSPSVFVLIGLAACGAVRADTLVMDSLQQAQQTAAERPTRGMTMDTVAAKWGQPTAKRAAVGQPPISRWDYGSFVVFFEYNHVIHSVIKHP